MARKVNKSPAQKDLPPEMQNTREAEEYRKMQFTKMEQRCPACLMPMAYDDINGWRCTNPNCIPPAIEGKEKRAEAPPSVTVTEKKGVKSKVRIAATVEAPEDEHFQKLQASVKRFRRFRRTGGGCG